MEGQYQNTSNREYCIMSIVDVENFLELLLISLKIVHHVKQRSFFIIKKINGVLLINGNFKMKK